MIDKLMLMLRDVANILIPTVVLVLLILLGLILWNVLKIVKSLPATVSKVDDVLDATQKTVDQLDAPLTTLKNVSGTVDLVNNSAVSMLNKAVSMGAKHSDAVVSWFNDRRKNKQADDVESSSTMETHTENNEEDFGVYE